MAIELITNTVWKDSALVLPTDSSNAATSDTANIENITRGPRHLEWAQTGTAVRRLVYENKRGNLGANRCVITRADRYSSGYTIRKYSTYSGSATTIEDAASAPTCIGQNSQDYVASFTAAASQQAFSVEFKGSGAKIVNKIYFGTALAFAEPQSPTISPYWDRYSNGSKTYLCSEVMNIQFKDEPATTATSLEAQFLLKEEPCFLYDSAGTILADKLWHCIVSNLQVTPMFNDKYQVDLQVYRLREYPSVA
jgi:hypothetical protein